MNGAAVAGPMLRRIVKMVENRSAHFLNRIPHARGVECCTGRRRWVENSIGTQGFGNQHRTLPPRVSYDLGTRPAASFGLGNRSSAKNYGTRTKSRISARHQNRGHDPGEKCGSIPENSIFAISDSWRTISVTSSSNVVRGAHPSFSLALAASPRRFSTSAGRK
jgi:hypothetical protein